MTRRLRTFVSVFFTKLTELLCVWCVRSYSTRDHLRWRVTTSRAISISSREGILGVVTWTKELDGVSTLAESGPVAGRPPRRRMSNPFGFEFLRSKEYDSVGVIVPYWFGALICAICVIIPQIFNSRRYSLRTMFIATMLLAIVLGLAMWLAA